MVVGALSVSDNYIRRPTAAPPYPTMPDDSAEYVPWAVMLVAIGIALELMVFMTSALRYLGAGFTLGAVAFGPAFIGAGLTLPSNRTEAGALVGLGFVRCLRCRFFRRTAKIQHAPDTFSAPTTRLRPKMGRQCERSRPRMGRLYSPAILAGTNVSMHALARHGAFVDGDDEDLARRVRRACWRR